MGVTINGRGVLTFLFRALGAAPILIAVFAGAPLINAQINVSLSTSLPSPEPVGTPITWTAASNIAQTSARYRFRVRRIGHDFQVMKDYGPGNTLIWTAADH